MSLGSRASMSGKKMLEGPTMGTYEYDETTFMIYADASQDTRYKSIEDLNITKGHEVMEKYGLSNTVVHTPYIINIANITKPETPNLGVDFLQQRIERTQTIGAKDIVLHPDAHIGAGIDAGINKIIEGSNEILANDNNVRATLETMAGKGTEIGRSSEELARIIDGVHNNKHLSVRFDTYHTHGAGYNVKEGFGGVLGEFDKITGVGRIKVAHVNDSENDRGAQKDRHGNTDFGYIGFDVLSYIIHHGSFKDIPRILETPYVGEDKKNKKPPYKLEIKMSKQQHFDPELENKVMQQ